MPGCADVLPDPAGDGSAEIVIWLADIEVCSPVLKTVVLDDSIVWVSVVCADGVDDADGMVSATVSLVDSCGFVSEGCGKVFSLLFGPADPAII